MITRETVLRSGAKPYILRKDHGYQPPGMHCYVRRLPSGLVRAYFIYCNYMEFEARELLFCFGAKVPKECEVLLLDEPAPAAFLVHHSKRWSGFWKGEPLPLTHPGYIAHDYKSKCMYLEGIEDPATFKTGPGRWGQHMARSF